MFILLLSLAASDRIERFPCAVNYEGYLYNLSELASGRPNGFDIIKLPNDDRYYFKMCGELPHDELPPLAPDSTDISVMRCNYSSHECATGIALQSFDWKPIRADSPEDGVIYYGEGEPFIDPEDDQWYTIDFEYYFYCDKSDSNPKTNYTYLVINKTNEVVVRVIFFTSFGCPAKTPAPSPTPLFNPDCDFSSYSIPMFGFYADFKEFNQGPYGIRTPLNVNGEKKVLFYQPCGKMLCPPNYTCENDDYSSAWLCNYSNKYCYNYGTIHPDGFDAKFKPGSRNSIIITHHNEPDNREIELEVGCNYNFEYDHFLFQEDASMRNGILSVVSSAPDVCYGSHPYPFPFDTETCSMNLLEYGFLNLSAFNNPDGYQLSVTDTNNNDYTLYYQPCGGISCPSEAGCGGDTNATVWLCSNVAGIKDCVAYGLLKNNFTYSQLINQVNLYYTGDRHREANVYYRCKEDAKELDFSTNISIIDGTKLSFVIYNDFFCLKIDKRSGVTGGAIFLIILFSGALVYVISAIIYGYIKYGKIEPPHPQFWSEFFNCVFTAVGFIFTCGKQRTFGNFSSKYDAI